MITRQFFYGVGVMLLVVVGLVGTLGFRAESCEELVQREIIHRPVWVVPLPAPLP